MLLSRRYTKAKCLNKKGQTVRYLQKPKILSTWTKTKKKKKEKLSISNCSNRNLKTRNQKIIRDMILNFIILPFTQ